MSQDPSYSAPPPPPFDPPPPPGADGSARFPWEERDRIGFLEALIETVKVVVTAPREAFSRLRPDGDYLWPLLFGLILSWIGQFFAQIWNLIFGEAIRSMVGGFNEFGDMAQFMGTGVAQVVISLIIWPVLYAVLVFLFAGISHLALMLVAALDESPLGFEGTFKVVAYASVLDLLNVVPLAGWLLAFLGKLVIYAIGFAAVHRTSDGKAIGAVALVFFTCCCCLPALLAGIFGMLGAVIGGIWGAAGAS